MEKKLNNPKSNLIQPTNLWVYSNQLNNIMGDYFISVKPIL